MNNIIRKIKKVFLSAVIIAIVLNAGFYFYIKYKVRVNKKYYDEIKNNPKVFVYETFFGAINAALYIDDIKYNENLIGYYKNAECRKVVPIDFPIDYMPYPTPVYYIGKYSKDTSLIEVVDFDTTKWGYVKGYVYYRTVHESPPPDSLMKLKEKFIQDQNHSDNTNKSKYKKPSKYGLQFN